MNRKAIGETLRELRGSMSPEIASKHLGVSRSALYMYERGERMPRDDVKIKIAKLYGKSVSTIFFSQQ